MRRIAFVCEGGFHTLLTAGADTARWVAKESTVPVHCATPRGLKPAARPRSRSRSKARNRRSRSRSPIPIRVFANTTRARPSTASARPDGTVTLLSDPVASTEFCEKYL